MSRLASVQPTQGGASFVVAWRLADKQVLVVGGGKVAAGRVRLALDADAKVRVVAPRLGAELRHRWSEGTIDWRPDLWHADDLDGVDLVLACLDDPDVSASIAEAARARNIPVNCADHVPLCDFWFTSGHREGALQLALSTNGQGPAMGARLMRELATRLPEGISEALEAFGSFRSRIRDVDPTPAASSRRMRFVGHVGRTWTWQALRSLDPGSIDRLVQRYRAGDDAPDGPDVDAPRRGEGRVRLVGAGPGDPKWLTVAAMEALQEADLVLADRLVPRAILDLVHGELRIARKVPGRAQSAQDELDAWTLEAAQAGRDVVRLKCGDPFVFGRGGEELAFLRSHGLDAEVIPGVTSAFAAPLAAGIPTTMRGHADRVLVLTATGRHDTRTAAPSFDDSTTFVWLMGVKRMHDLFAELQREGFPAHWPAAVVERAGHPTQRVHRGTIATLPDIAAAAGVTAPAALVVGRVVDALSEAQVAERLAELPRAASFAS